MIKAAWDRVTRDNLLRAIGGYDRLVPEQFFAHHGFGSATTYELVLEHAVTQTTDESDRRQELLRPVASRSARSN